jgi:hypothetical protein
MNDSHDVVAYDFCDDFVLHCSVCTAAQAVYELSLNRGERSLDIRAHGVMIHKLFAVQLEKVKHLGPNAATQRTTCE